MMCRSADGRRSSALHMLQPCQPTPSLSWLPSCLLVQGTCSGVGVVTPGELNDPAEAIGKPARCGWSVAMQEAAGGCILKARASAQLQPAMPAKLVPSPH